MEFHPSKCQLVCITNKRQPIPASYCIHGVTLVKVPSAKYLGLHVDSKLNFNTHVDITTKKANSTRAFLGWNFHHCSCKIKEATYKTYVCPILEYATVAWSPHTQRNIQKVEQVQRNCARYVTSNYSRQSSLTTMLRELEWPSLESRRDHICLAMLYRIRLNLVDIDWKNHLKEHTSSTRGHGSRFWTLFCSNQN